MKGTTTALLGVRHHGPGSARAVGAALAQFRPDVVLIEGPPEADALLPLAASKEMTPPVALLAHVVDEPARAAFWPFAAFSPEWVALRYALDAEVPVRFIDLPAAHTFALAAQAEAARDSVSSDDGAEGDADECDADEDAHEGEERHAARFDPIAELARAAGQEDAERWWDDVVEHVGHQARGSGDGSDVGPDVGAVPGAAGARAAPDAMAPFQALATAMTVLREQAPEVPEDARREAYMRKQIRAASRAGHQRIAVVCGAWHVPALSAKVSVAADNALLRGLPKAAVEVTWVPWTHRRLSQHTGYGAGIASPGWYQHLFESGGRHVVERWFTRMAALLREEDHPVSSAHVIEAVRLAETLAAVRGRPLAGLTETTDAARAVLCDGSDVPLRLIEDRLIVGDALGQVPEAAPAVPLQRDLTRLQRSLRLKPEARVRVLELDLRKDLDAERSRLLHRLALLGIDWAVPTASQTRSTGTFRESWELAWEPELAVRVAEAGVWGTTVEAAASTRTASRAVEARKLADVTALAERCLLARLPEALPIVLRCLSDRAALDTDVAHLAEALPALVRSLRYGDVRATGTALLAELADSLATRVCIGLPAAAAALDPAAAQPLAEQVAATHAAIGLLAAARAGEDRSPADAGAGAGRGSDARADAGADGVQARWEACLRTLVARETAAAVVRGRAARLLLDDGRLPDEEAARLLGLALTPGVPPAEGAAWVDGFLAGSGVLLVHDQRLLRLVDEWITAIPAAAFPDVLPLLRRTFSRLETGVRRGVGELIRAGGRDVAAGAPGEAPRGFATELDTAQAGPALATVRLILGTLSISEK
ncbi:hypothetical protein DN069_04155 [Streptacidiphilus pinicola]|uniref:Uncharacterized protein n=1 Tax=Streptacidiphilus pinicola TaxID=2219663 RepID=A0A2X0INY2_9ACTN|nr:DUF5682 family protein [Streptacidiphilus pinicola]RAG86932.1 hypothetical protein DN069_04155 [Streptacidiphilus pinicola]